MRKHFSILCLLLMFASTCNAQLAVTYGMKGVERLSYHGVILMDTARWKQDVFYIGHLKVTDRSGRVMTADGWGESNLGTHWDAATKSETYEFRWGSIRTQFMQKGDVLEISVTESNRTNSGVVLAGGSIYPLTLHFPALPPGFVDTNFPQGGSNASAPLVTIADFGAGQMVDTSTEALKPLYNMLWPANDGALSYSVLISSTIPDHLPTFLPHHDRPVLPGETDTFRISLRFAPSGLATEPFTADAYASWAQQHASTLHWTDKRIIGTAYLASSPAVNTRIGTSEGNPRRYFINSGGSGIDVRSYEGRIAFQSRVLKSAEEIVRNLRRLHAQGVITWDIEGEEYPQSTSYVCAPDQIATVAPEMDSVITDATSAFRGKKLDDSYFSIIRNAGFKVGVCIRPQKFVVDATGVGRQKYAPQKDAEAEMLRKIRYAHDRWGATLFYLDSTVDESGAPLDAAIFARLVAAFPDSLLIPEQSTPKHYAYTAPLKSFVFHHETGTDASVKRYSATAFSCTLVNDADGKLLMEARPSLVAAVVAGDILMAHADYWDSNNAIITAIYDQAARVRRGH